MSAIAITALTKFKIGEATFSGQGTYSDAWTLQCKWENNGGETLGPADLVDIIFPGLEFDPDNHLPSLTFSSASASLSPGVECSFKCISSINWPQPFGLSVGLAIDGLGVLFQKALANSSSHASLIQASGVLQVDGESVEVLTYFIKGSPALILVDSIATLSLNALFKHFDLDMPTNFIDLSFTNSQIYYSPNGVTTGMSGKLPPITQGLNVASQVTLKLALVTFPTMDVVVAITRASGHGMTVTGCLEQSVELAGFLTLTGANPIYSGGPELQLDSTNGKSICRLKCGLRFLGENFGLTGIDIISESGKISLSATLSYPGTLGPFTNLNLSMTYSDATGFQITNWPGFEVENQALDFVKLLQQVNKNSKCGKLGDFVCNNLKTHFTISPQFTTTKPDVNPLADGQFYFVLTGFYTISATDIVVCTVNLPTLALSFTSPADFCFYSIIDKVGELIVANGVQVVEQLYNNQQALAKCIAVFVGRKVAQELAQSLCDDLKDSLEDFLDELPKDTGGGTLEALGSAGSAIISLVSSGHKCGGGGSSPGGDSPNITPLVPPAFVSSSLAGMQWTVNWIANPDATYYVVQLFGSGRVLVGSVQYIQTNSVTLDFNDFSSSPYILQVAAYAFPGLNTNSQFSSRVLLQLASPTTVNSKIDYQSGELLCTFSPVINASDYTATVVDAASNGQLAQSTSWTLSGDPPQVTFSFDVMALRPFPKQYLIGVVATGGDQYIPSAAFFSSAFTVYWGVGYAKVGLTFNVS